MLHPVSTEIDLSRLALIFLRITANIKRTLLPVGPAYLAHVRRELYNLSFEEQDKRIEEDSKRLGSLNNDSVNGEDDLGVGDEEETEDLLSLDPKEWKVHTIIHRCLDNSKSKSKPSADPETRSLCRSRPLTFALPSHTRTNKNSPFVLVRT
jgi:hypothetical protein